GGWLIPALQDPLHPGFVSRHHQEGYLLEAEDLGNEQPVVSTIGEVGSSRAADRDEELVGETHRWLQIHLPLEAALLDVIEEAVHPLVALQQVLPVQRAV